MDGTQDVAYARSRTELSPSSISPVCKSAVTNANAALKVEWLKLTVLSLSGIHVQETGHKHRKQSKARAKNFSITASVSFTGSCDPAALRVVSSGLCTTSGLLTVESQPVVVPSGMTDGLIAIWDDSIRNLRHQGSLFSSDEIIFGKQRGAISACPKANPHLFVNLHDQNQYKDESCAQDLDSKLKKNENNARIDLRKNEGIGDTQDSTVISSLSYGPDLDETDISSCPTGSTRLVPSSCRADVHKRIDSQTKSGPLHPTTQTHTQISEEIEQEENPQHSKEFLGSPRKHSIEESGTSQGSDIHCALINTPTPAQMDQESHVPEILEMQIALHINQVPMMDPFKDEDDLNVHTQSVRSLCEPSAEGGGAVAHLILFPDILNEKDGNGKSNEDLEYPVDGNERVFALPVRKRPAPLTGSYSTVSSLTSRDVNRSMRNESHRHRYSPDPDAYVDIEDDAFIRVKLELCSEDESKSLTGNDQNAYKTGYRGGSSTFSGKINSGENVLNMSLHNLLEEEGDHTKDQDDSLVGQVANMSSHGFDDSVQDDGDYIDQLEEAKEHLNKFEDKMSPEMKGACGRSGLGSIVKSLKDMIGYCGDDAGVYQGLVGVASMDSTIYTAGSINM